MLNIIEFAELCNTTPTTLLMWEQLNILSPTSYDNVTNIRYYTAEQAQKVKDIVLLTELGFSNIEIHTLIRRPLTKDVLMQKKDSLEKEIAKATTNLNKLEKQIRRLSSATAVDIRVIPPVYCFGIRRIFENPQDMIIEFMNQIDSMKQLGIEYKPSMRKRAIYYDKETKMDKFDAECLIDLGIPERTDIKGIKHYPGYPAAAHIVHHDNIQYVTESYNLLHEWIIRNNYYQTGPAHEAYIPSSPESGRMLSSDFDTEIFIPVERR